MGIRSNTGTESGRACTKQVNIVFNTKDKRAVEERVQEAVLARGWIAEGKRVNKERRKRGRK